MIGMSEKLSAGAKRESQGAIFCSKQVRIAKAMGHAARDIAVAEACQFMGGWVNYGNRESGDDQFSAAAAISPIDATKHTPVQTRRTVEMGMEWAREGTSGRWTTR